MCLVNLFRYQTEEVVQGNKTCMQVAARHYPNVASSQHHFIQTGFSGFEQTAELMG